MASMIFPLAFERQYEGPLDVSMTFETTADLNDYLTNPTRYAGQIVTCEEAEGTIYVLNNARDAWIAGGGGGGDVSADITSLVDVGAISAGDVVTAGSTLDQVLTQLLIQTFYPSLVAPGAQLTVSSPLVVEAGATSDLDLTATFDRGQILGDMSGSVWDPAAVQDFRAGAETAIRIDGVVAAGGTRTLTAQQIVDGTNTFNAEIDYDIGPQPLDSTGANYDAPLAAGTALTSIDIEGQRNRWHGTPATLPTDSAGVRGLSESALNPQSGGNFSISIPIGAVNVVFAYPETLGEVSSVKYVEGLNAEVKGIFTESVISVEGANGYTAINYRVYTYTPAAPFSATATYNVTI